MRFWVKFKKRRLKKKINQLFRLLKGIDKAMVALHYSRQRRRRLWREFIKSSDNRARITKLFGDIIFKE